jgi:hypothetical protein
MNRRDAVVNLLAVSGTLISLPFWMTACRMSEGGSHVTSFTAEEQSMLAAIVDTIIPAGKNGGEPGALSVGVDKYLQKLIDDCYEPAAREAVKKQLHAVEAATKAANGGSFGQASVMDRQGILQKFGGSADKDEKEFISTIKRETIKGFNTSQEVMVNYLNYKIAPGHYYGSVPVKKPS